eukprot:gene37294-48760_t
MEEQNSEIRKRPIDEISEEDDEEYDDNIDALAASSEFSQSENAPAYAPNLAPGNYYVFMSSNFAVPEFLKSSINPAFVTVYEHIIELCPLELKVYIVGPLWHFISANCHENIANCNLQVFRFIHKSYFRADICSTKEGRDLLFQFEIVMKAAIIYYLSLQPAHVAEMALTLDELLTEYPQLVAENLNSVELYLLLTYWKYMRVAVSLIPSRSNKKLLSGICALLEGAGRKYVFGSGQKPSTSHRVAIYEQESKLRRQQRTADGDDHRKSEESASGDGGGDEDDDDNNNNNNNNEDDGNANANAARDLPLGQQYYNCICGAAVKYKGYSRHANSNRHKTFLVNQTSSSSSLSTSTSSNQLFTSSVTAPTVVKKN